MKNSKYITSLVFLFASLGLYAQQYKYNTDTLAHIITKNDTTEIQKAYSIYQWVSQHIAFDTRNFSHTNDNKQDTRTVLRHRKALSIGYANLVNELCQAAGLHCYIVPGYVHNLAFVPGIACSIAHHTWNIVVIENKQIQLDAAMGAGSLYYTTGDNIILRITDKLNKQLFSPKAQFRKQYTNTFFNFNQTSPPLFHLPADPVWQPAHNYISYQQYMQHNYPLVLQNNVYTDSLYSFTHSNIFQQWLQTALRSEQYNPANCYTKALLYARYARFLYEKAQITSSATDSIKKLKYQQAITYFNQAINSYKTSEKHLKSAYKAKQKYLQNNARVLNKTIEKQRNYNQKIKTSNKKLIAKNKSQQKKLNARIVKLQKHMTATGLDDKIYDIESPQQFNRSNLLKINNLRRQSDSLNTKTRSLIDSVQLTNEYFTRASHTFDTLKARAYIWYNKQILQYSDSIIFLLDNKTGFRYADTISYFTAQLRHAADTATKLTKYINTGENMLLKTSLKEIKQYHNQIKKLTKDNKKLLTELKTISPEGTEYEVMYSMQNQQLIAIDQSITTWYTTNYNKINTEKHFLNHQLKLVNKQNKKLSALARKSKRIYNSYLKFNEHQYNLWQSEHNKAVSNLKFQLKRCQKDYASIL